MNRKTEGKGVKLDEQIEASSFDLLRQITAIGGYRRQGPRLSERGNVAINLCHSGLVPNPKTEKRFRQQVIDNHRIFGSDL